ARRGRYRPLVPVPVQPSPERPADDRAQSPSAAQSTSEAAAESPAKDDAPELSVPIVDPASEHPPETAVRRRTVAKTSVAALTLGALGVVFGDIGTSPLYAL